MKFYIGWKGGPSPGLELVGTRQDLRELSVRLGSAVNSLEKEGKEEGTIRFSDLVGTGDGPEWIAFRSVREVDSLFASAATRAKRRFYFYAPVLWALGLGLLYLAYLGIRSLMS